MEMTAAGTLEISGVLYEDAGRWIAQGIEYDITASGASRDEASKRFLMKVGAELVMSLELGDKFPLAGVAQAPAKFWRMFDDATEWFDVDRPPFRVLNEGPVPRVFPYMKVSELRVAA